MTYIIFSLSMFYGLVALIIWNAICAEKVLMRQQCAFDGGVGVRFNFINFFGSNVLVVGGGSIRVLEEPLEALRWRDSWARWMWRSIFPENLDTTTMTERMWWGWDSLGRRRFSPMNKTTRSERLKKKKKRERKVSTPQRWKKKIKKRVENLVRLGVC